MNIEPRLSWKAALTFMTREAGWKGKLGLAGLMILVCPPLGWVMALGFRSLTGARLVEGLSPVLPPWRGHLGAAFLHGLGASGVILGYFAPFMILYWALAARSWADFAHHFPEAAYFLAAVVVFPPAFLPSLPVLYCYWYEWMALGSGEIAVLATLFFATAFVLPSVFTQVALRGGYAGALRLRCALRYLSRNLPTYLEAWALSLVVSGAALFSGPLMPWGLAWSYLAILYAFNESLSQWQTDEVRVRFRNSGFQESPGP